MRQDFQREIKLNFSRFLSITLSFVVGVAFFSGLRAAKPAMQAAADKQYDSENRMDIRVAGTLGTVSYTHLARSGSAFLGYVQNDNKVYDQDQLYKRFGAYARNV